MKLSAQALNLINDHLNEIEAQCPDVSSFDRDVETLNSEWLEMTREECVSEFEECEEESDVDDFLNENAIVAGRTMNTIIFKF